ncbi:MAG: DUF3108 domain-containing protein [Bacteroidia bacterium]
MKIYSYKIIKIVACFFVLSLFVFFKQEPLISKPTTLIGVPELPAKTNEAFKVGEVLSYRLHYGIIDAGVAVIQVMPQVQDFGGHQVYHIVGDGYSKGTFNWFFKVKDRYETYIDKDALVPWYFMRRCNEGGYIINQDYLFNHYTKKVDIGGNQTFDVPVGIQDMLSSFYYARNIDFTNAKEGTVYEIPSFVDKQTWTLKIKYVGKETINTDVGKFRCIKFRPIIQTGRIFKKEEDLNVWITDDKNHIPIRAQAKIVVGSIKMDLTSYKNLANPTSKVE